MEACELGAFCTQAGIPAAGINTVLVDRLAGDKVTLTAEELAELPKRGMHLALRLLLRSGVTLNK